MNFLDVMAAAGGQNQGFQAQQTQARELQAQQIAAQRLAQLVSMQGQGPGFQAGQPGAMPGMPPMGMPMQGGGMNSPQGGPVPLSGATDGGAGSAMPPMMPGSGPAVGGAPQITPYPAMQPQGGGGDPFSMPSIASAVFGPGGGQGPADFMAFQNIEKTMRPYGQIMGRSQLENQRQQGRLGLEDEKQTNRMELLQQKNAVIMRGQDKQYQARIAAIGARANPAQKAALDTATKEFQQASMNYRNAKISMNSTPEDIDKLADVALAAQQKMEGEAAKIGGSPAPAGGQPGSSPAAGKEKIKPGEEVRYDQQGNAFVNRNGQAVPAEK